MAPQKMLALEDSPETVTVCLEKGELWDRALPADPRRADNAVGKCRDCKGWRLFLLLAVFLILYATLSLCSGYFPHQQLEGSGGTVTACQPHVLMGNSSTRIMSTAAKAGFKPRLHYKCRGGTYPRDDNVQRFPVPDEKVAWSVTFPEYEPSNFTSDGVLKGPVWADLDHRNPVGRTGVCARGCLGRWGPNHAADPIVTRWKRDERGKVLLHSGTSKPILQFIAIQRRDSGEWAIPGGMVDPGELISQTLQREFGEEAMNCLEADKDERKQIENEISHLFETGDEGMVAAGEQVSETLKREFGEETMNSLEATRAEKNQIRRTVQDCFRHGTEVFRGYVDDPRNTDNSWMETVAVNFHDDAGNSVGRFKLNAGDDAVGVMWTDMDSNLKLFASHSHFIKEVAKRRGAHW